MNGKAETGDYSLPALRPSGSPLQIGAEDMLVAVGGTTEMVLLLVIMAASLLNGAWCEGWCGWMSIEEWRWLENKKTGAGRGLIYVESSSSSLSKSTMTSARANTLLYSAQVYRVVCAWSPIVLTRTHTCLACPQPLASQKKHVQRRPLLWRWKVGDNRASFALAMHCPRLPIRHEAVCVSVREDEATASAKSHGVAVRCE